jgi:anti-sigma B factor antagonist
LRHLVRDHLSECKQVVVDLGKVSYIDSGGIGVLVGLYSTAKKAGGGIKLAKLSPLLEDTLQITKILTVFGVRPGGGRGYLVRRERGSMRAGRVAAR